MKTIIIKLLFYLFVIAMSSGWVFAETTDFFAEYDLGDKLGGGAYGKSIYI